MSEIEARFIGSMMGTFVGDALGRPYEGRDGKSIDINKIENPLYEGRYTDDTQMMISIAESLIENKGFEGADVARKFTENFDPMRGYGSGAVRVIQRLLSGVSWNHSGSAIFRGGSYGNGAAMRIAPLGLLYHHDKDKLLEVALFSSIITHTHILGKTGAALQACSVALALQYGLTGKLNPTEMVDKLKDELPSDAEIYHEKLDHIVKFLKSTPSQDEVIINLGNGVAAFDSVPTAIYSFLRHIDFKNSVIFAIGLGGDTDTIGAMSGAIAGAYHGYKCIPENWLNKLENGYKGRDYVTKLAKELYNTWVVMNSGF
ncbi:hypothetical protein GF312_16165 [Candidatus Poribacteria bacterium]|nr:hypothetical protein [Candidatus Poribacteria bacterium]